MVKYLSVHEVKRLRDYPEHSIPWFLVCTQRFTRCERIPSLGVSCLRGQTKHNSGQSLSESDNLIHFQTEKTTHLENIPMTLGFTMNHSNARQAMDTPAKQLVFTLQRQN